MSITIGEAVIWMREEEMKRLFYKDFKKSMNRALKKIMKKARKKSNKQWKEN